LNELAGDALGVFVVTADAENDFAGGHCSNAHVVALAGGSRVHHINVKGRALS
jgi:hypothetical protein